MGAEALDLFNALYEPAKLHQDGMADQWDLYEQAYFGEPEGDKPTGDHAWRSWFFYKYAFQQVKTLVAELAAVTDPTFEWEAENPDQDAYAHVCDALIGRMFRRDAYAEKRPLAIETAAITGGQPVKVHWIYRTVKRTRLTAGGPVTEEFVVLDQPTMTLVDPRDFMYDPRARNMRECRYAFHRMRLSLEELRAKRKSNGKPFYKNLDQLENIPGGNSDMPSVRKLDHDYSGERDKAHRDGIEVIEMWTRDRVIVRAAGGIIIRDDPNPYWHGRLPFEVITLMPSLNDVWGTSVVWTIKDVQDLLHTLDNASMDALKLAIDPPLNVSLEDPENMTKPTRPAERFGSRSGATPVTPIKVQGIEHFTSEQAIQSARNQMEYISGITREMAGQSDADTATQAALNQRQAKGRVGIMMGAIDASFARIAELFLQLSQQYLDLSRPVKILGPEGEAWRHIAPREIAGLWLVRPKNSSEQVVKELHRQNLMEALSALLPMAGQAMPSGRAIDVTPIVEELGESFGIRKDRLIVDAQQMRAQHQADVVADGEAQAQVMQMTAPPPQEGPPPPDVREQLIQSINYKDLPDAAQADLLQEAGLSPEGVEDDNRNPTRPNAGASPNPISEGLLAYSGSTQGAQQ